MFTGLVEAVGTIAARKPSPDGQGLYLAVQAPFAGELSAGESVAVNGTCLTVLPEAPEPVAGAFWVECSPTTLEITTLGGLPVGGRVNLERAVRAESRLGGHWVQGHVDTRGEVVAVTELGNARQVCIAFPARFRRLVLDKGSVAVEGVSLTVVSQGVDEAGDTAWFEVTLIPHTLAETTLNDLVPGQPVNLEFDILGKYVVSLLGPYLERLDSRPA
ncbi:Riboflavin synthase [Candidatus Hydrogenisulfobacillus filiaventi]|uniref:Riboflavin synthase n=1 Tax=Candidatus Hydrogenisulfobacillus filiaventi TaxID=2707344 RepID=A0A6F8ZK85_9FIRM|nr:riboflavin synthase [Bacillota bacterium]CAB1130012.1 Riboflavin synthase [Candidatus Hydrogenisulfobacillus filiaventi]